VDTTKHRGRPNACIGSEILPITESEEGSLMGNGMKVKDSVAFISGGNRGFGMSFAEELLARGAKKVYVGARDLASVTASGVVPVQLDVTVPESVEAAAQAAPDVTLLVNNAGTGGLHENSLDPNLIRDTRGILETNFYGVIRLSQAFAPIITANGGGGVINVLSDQSWFARPFLAAYAASKSAAWSYTNALRIDLKDRGTQVLGLHVGFMDTEFVAGLEVKKSDPRHIAALALEGLEAGHEEVLADEQARLVKSSLSAAKTYYMAPAEIA
jgi:NAD(P)-dependent dehydrogenase (short-subunit alcohol dehydrogenase family)